MKKVVVFVLLGLFLAISMSFNAEAADDLIDLYPYDQQACLEAANACTQTKVGSSYWTFEYAGYRYHFVRGAARYVSEFNDANANGLIAANEMGALSWNAFAGVIFNNTDETVVLSTLNARTDLTSVVHRIYTYWDADGVLQMVENHIHTYYIFNDGTPEAPDWRLATEAEKTAYDAADPKPATTRVAYVRMKLDDTDTDGYVLEPLGYLKWTNADVDTVADTNVENWSTIITGDPNYVTIPADWSVVTFGTFDRGSYKATELVTKIPTLMVDETVDPIAFHYAPQPSVFSNELGAMDDDPASEGINVVVEYNGTFDLPNNISVSWVDMFDDMGAIIHKTEKLDYEVEISQEGMILETIEFTYDEVTDSYTPSGAVTVIDSSAFGDGYLATYRAINPEMQVTEREVDIVIGVMPPKFVGVANRYVDEDMYVDLLDGITADDGYGNDITDTIQVTYPAGFNYYNPQPGQYQIDLEFSHHVHFDGVQSTLDFNGTIRNWNEVTGYNADINVNTYANYAVFDDLTNFRDAASAWGSVFVVVGADGKVDEIYDRYDWGYTSATENDVIKDLVHFTAWQAAVTIEEGGYIVTAHGSTYTPPMRALTYDSPVTLVIGYPDFDYDIIKNASYTLTVDDTTAPVALIVDENYTIEMGQYSNRDDAILANVVVFDYFDAIDDLAVYVSNNGNLNLNAGGTYPVEVTVEDLAGNTTVVSFDVHVVPAPASEQDVIDMIDEQAVNEDEINGILDSYTFTQAEIQAMIDAAKAEATQDALDSLPEDQVGTQIGVTIVIALGASAISFIGAILFLKKKPL